MDQTFEPPLKYKDLPPLPAIGLWHRGPYNLIGEKFAVLSAWAAPAGLFAADPKVICASFDSPDVTPAAELRSIAAIEFAETAEIPGGAPAALERFVFSGGTYAVATHKGSYTGLPMFFRAVLQRIKTDGRRCRADPCYEVYLNSPGDTPEEELLTIVHAPVETQ